MDSFFQSLPPTKQFEASADLSRYSQAPADWSVAVFDVVDSTFAIENNRYKDVNAVGVCCITAALNALTTKDVPYVFGGDGATMLFPSTEHQQLSIAMQGLQQLTEIQFGLKLRTGIVPIADIRARGRDVLISRYQLSDSKSVALFAGGGTQLADQLIKNSALGGAYRITRSSQASNTSTPSANTEGFSCRWQPIGSHRGVILTGLIQTQMFGDMQSYNNVIERLCDIIGDPRARNPARNPGLKLSGRWSDYEREARLQASKGTRVGQLWAQFIAFRNTQISRFFTWLKLKLGSYDGTQYRAMLIEQTDHLRFDDMFRFVLDVSESEVSDIGKSLESLYQSGKIFYGTQTSQQALMTCIVNDYHTDHVHFLDGGDGGFTMAAKNLKNQIRSTTTKQDNNVA